MRLLFTDTDSVMAQIFELQDPLHAMADANLNGAALFDVTPRLDARVCKAAWWRPGTLGVVDLELEVSSRSSCPRPAQTWAGPT